MADELDGKALMAVHGTLVCDSVGAITNLSLFIPVVCFIHVFDQTLAEQLYRDKRNATQRSMSEHNITHHTTPQHNTTQHKKTQHNTTQHSTAQHNTTQYSTGLKNTKIKRNLTKK